MTIRSWSASGIVCLSLAIGSAVGHSKDGSPQSTSAASEAISGKRSDQAGSSAPVSQADDEAALSELPTAGTEAGEVRYFTASKIPFCWCPPGSFLMGSPADERSRRDDETPISVTLTEGFWIQQHELTQREWRAATARIPWEELDLGSDLFITADDYPAVYVSWADATRFCRTVTLQETNAGRLTAGQYFQLPTEAQWEYACRAGTTTAWSFGADGSLMPEFGWFVENTWNQNRHHAHMVAAKHPNPWNIFDMHGNVWEWCYDNYRKTLPGGINPIVLDRFQPNRVCRGGGWSDLPPQMRSAARAFDIGAAGSIYNATGFRMVLVLKEIQRTPDPPGRRRI